MKALFIATLGIITVVFLADVANSKCSKDLKRQFNFDELDPHFQLTIDEKEGRKADKALQGSRHIYEGRKNEDVNIYIKYIFNQEDREDNRGFNGKICFRVKRAVKLTVHNRGIPYMHCDVLPKTGETCAGFPGVRRRLQKPFAKRNLRLFVHHCLTVESSEIKIRLTAQDGHKIQLKHMFIRACEKNTKRIDATLVNFPDLKALLQGLLDLETREPPFREETVRE